MKWSYLGTMLLGLALIAVLAPLAQFLTVMTVNTDVETATPAGWAVGVVFSLVLVLGTIRVIARRWRMHKPNIVLLYVMLTVAVPLMNLGLVRPVYLSMQMVLREYVLIGVGTYRTAYNQLDPDWFPVVPTDRGLAWNRADRLLSLLEQHNPHMARRRAAGNVLTSALSARARVRRGEHRDANAAPIRAPGRETIAELGFDAADEALRERRRWTQEDLEALDLLEPLRRRMEQAAQASRVARSELEGLLKGVDEFEVSLLDSHWASMDPSSRDRVLTLEPGLEDPNVRLERTGEVRGILEKLQALVASLSRADRAALRSAVASRYLERYAEMGAEEVAALRGHFMYRLSAARRKAIAEQDGESGTPQQDFGAFRTGLWDELDDQKRIEDLSPVGRFLLSARQLPWHLWVRPILSWTLLCVVVFLLLMCAAEWFRTKWIERENLPFPLVEVADHIIRHDADLEMAEDERAPPRRGWPVNPILLAGIALGFFMLSLEAASHYGFTSGDYVLFYDVKKELLTTGVLRRLEKTILVISPIAVGLLFLVSLEVSFSVWTIFFLLSGVAAGIHLWHGEIKDDLFTGWAGGRWYPFRLAQLLGATLCFASVVIYKSIARRGDRATGNWFVPPRLSTAGLIVLPLVVLALLWDLGVVRSWQSLVFTGIVGVFVAAQVVAAARVRAETGLPTHHISYPFVKFPIAYGLSGFLGARAYAAFVNVVFLPITLLLRMLPQHLENMELARRHELSFRAVMWATLLAMVAALAVGMYCFPVMAYWMGEEFYGQGAQGQGETPRQIAGYSLYVSHYFGEGGLDKFTQVHWIRVWPVLAGFGLVGLLMYLRTRFLRFPLHPLGYLLLLLSPYYPWVSYYAKGDPTDRAQAISWLWASALVAWLIKKLILKYGGMNAYKRAKPFFIGLVVGSVLAVFAWNVTDLVCSLVAEYVDAPSAFVRHFLEKRPYNPAYY